MSYTLQKLVGEPILVATPHDDYQVSTDLLAIVAEATRILDAEPNPVYLIQDLLQQPDPTIDDLLYAASLLARGPDALLHHPKIKALLVVTVSDMIRLSYQGAASEVFGSLQTVLFTSLAEALAYARAAK